MVIPATVVQLNESDIPLGQAPREQTVGSERSRLADVFSVEPEDMLRFTGRVYQLRNAGLHPEAISYWAMRVSISGSATRSCR